MPKVAACRRRVHSRAGYFYFIGIEYVFFFRNSKMLFPICVYFNGSYLHITGNVYQYWPRASADSRSVRIL